MTKNETHTTPSSAGAWPTNDQVYEEVRRQRGSLPGYVSTNAVNDVMAAVRALAPLPAAVAPTATSPDGLPKWIDDLKGKDPTIDALIEHILQLSAPAARIDQAVAIRWPGRRQGKWEFADVNDTVPAHVLEHPQLERLIVLSESHGRGAGRPGGGMVPLSTDGEHVWIEGEGEVPLCRCNKSAIDSGAGATEVLGYIAGQIRQYGQELVDAALRLSSEKHQKRATEILNDIESRLLELATSYKADLGIDKMGNTDHVGRNLDGVPQPYAGAIVLLETIAECGARAFVGEDRTENSKLCTRFANELREVAQTLSEQAKND